MQIWQWPRGDQRLERQVPLQLLAAVSGDPQGGRPGGQSETSPVPTWTPLLAAPYPDHVSGHLGLDGSHTGVLRMFFGDAPAGGYQITSFFVNPGGDATRRSPVSTRRSTSRRGAHLAGLHFRTADVQGRQLGANVANFAAANYFQRVGN